MGSSPDTHEQHIIRSWHLNAEPWSEAIRSGSIKSRKLATDRAIVEAVACAAAARVLDIGCGEGWLARRLTEMGIEVVGIDVVPALVAQAARGAGEFHVQDYASLANREFHCPPCDAAVCNFSLLGSDSVESMLAALHGYLRGRGRLLIQTLHPLAACGDLPYEDGWRDGSWQGFSAEFKDPAPWYFRTLESWLRMLRRCGFELLDLREPTIAGSSAPMSVLFTCQTLEVVNENR
jgi:2-polyprenyl-3-methyl-5-hydroxy-6-metoxy-1,4-benzoquinol methylase